MFDVNNSSWDPLMMALSSQQGQHVVPVGKYRLQWQPYLPDSDYTPGPADRGLNHRPEPAMGINIRHIDMWSVINCLSTKDNVRHKAYYVSHRQGKAHHRLSQNLSSKSFFFSVVFWGWVFYCFAAVDRWPVFSFIPGCSWIAIHQEYGLGCCPRITPDSPAFGLPGCCGGCWPPVRWPASGHGGSPVSAWRRGMEEGEEEA